MIWLYLSIISAFSFTALNIYSRSTSLKSKNPRAMSIIFNFMAILLAIGLFLVTGGYKKITFPIGWQPYFYLAVACLFFGLFERLRFYTTKALEASHLTIISNISLVVAVVMAFFLYKEGLTLAKFSGLFLILAALILVSIDKVKKIYWYGILISIIANIFLGIGWALDKKGANYFNPDTYNLLVWILPIIVIFLPPVKISEIVKEIKISSWKLWLLAFLNVFGYYLNLKAQFLTEATKVIPIVQLSTIFTVIFGALFLNEKEHIMRKVFAGIMAIVGVYFLV